MKNENTSMRLPYIYTLQFIIVVTLISGCNNEQTVNKQISQQITQVTPVPETEGRVKSYAPAKSWLEANQVYNKEAPIPPQCYTKTEQVNNPCYVCHQSYHDQKLRPNKLNDGFQQGSYAFSDIGVNNSWRNLFVDRTRKIAKISDKQILDYINQDNYSPFIEKLKDSDWKGVIPEIKNLHLGPEAFDEHGLAKDGSGWVAFNYKPMPSTFWPTNGSTDDVMIRLPDEFMQINGEYSRDAYYANLALVEMAITDTQETTTIPINEKTIKADLNGNGLLEEKVQHIKRSSHYLADASTLQLAHMLYPEGTAFLHTVRYVNVDDSGAVDISPRMKEVRYMVKKKFLSLGELKGRYYLERKEKHFENLPYYNTFGDDGVSNKHGWTLLGFIENEQGELRKQNDEEQFFCTGCHKSVGSIIDETFSFPRKVAGVNGWGYINLKSMSDVPNIGEEKGEIFTYLERVGGGDEFRQNQEMITRWFNHDGSVNVEKVLLQKSIYDLITPSRRRALDMNKAYKTIVEEQSFIYGRDATLVKAENVLSKVNETQAPLHKEHIYKWDIRLDWSKDKKVTVTNIGE
jgi:hypothetical protein